MAASVAALAAGSLHANYTLSDVLGSGNYATVWKATAKRAPGGKAKRAAAAHASADTVAVKSVDLNLCEDVADVEREIALMARAVHPHVVRLHEVYEEAPATKHLVLDLVAGGDLYDAIIARGSFSESESAQITHQLCDALEYLHYDLGIVHRDVKPDNILLTTPFTQDAPVPQVRLSDFGVAHCTSERTLLKEVWGTPGYMAPEVLRGTAELPVLDMWSVGVILHIMLSGAPPFPIPDAPEEEYAFLRSGGFDSLDFPGAVWERITEAAIATVRSLLMVDPTKRCTAADAVAHPWISGSTRSFTLRNGSKLSPEPSHTAISNPISHPISHPDGISSVAVRPLRRVPCGKKRKALQAISLAISSSPRRAAHAVRNALSKVASPGPRKAKRITRGSCSAFDVLSQEVPVVQVGHLALSVPTSPTPQARLPSSAPGPRVV